MPITSQLAQWLREKADELDAKDFPELMGGAAIKEVIAALTLSEPGRFAVVMEIEQEPATGLNAQFLVRDGKYAVIARGSTLADCYKDYLSRREPKEEVQPMEAVEQALVGTTEPF